MIPLDPLPPVKTNWVENEDKEGERIALNTRHNLEDLITLLESWRND